MFTHLDKTTTWQDKRIKAMDRVIGGNPHKHQYYIDEYCAIINSKAKNKKQYKGENNGNKNTR